MILLRFAGILLLLAQLAYTFDTSPYRMNWRNLKGHHFLMNDREVCQVLFDNYILFREETRVDETQYYAIIEEFPIPHSVEQRQWYAICLRHLFVWGSDSAKLDRIIQKGATFSTEFKAFMHDFLMRFTLGSGHFDVMRAIIRILDLDKARPTLEIVDKITIKKLNPSRELILKKVLQKAYRNMPTEERLILTESLIERFVMADTDFPKETILLPLLKKFMFELLSGFTLSKRDCDVMLAIIDALEFNTAQDALEIVDKITKKSLVSGRKALLMRSLSKSFTTLPLEERSIWADMLIEKYLKTNREILRQVLLMFLNEKHGMLDVIERAGMIAPRVKPIDLHRFLTSNIGQRGYLMIRFDWFRHFLEQKASTVHFYHLLVFLRDQTDENEWKFEEILEMFRNAKQHDRYVEAGKILLMLDNDRKFKNEFKEWIFSETFDNDAKYTKLIADFYDFDPPSPTASDLGDLCDAMNDMDMSGDEYPSDSTKSESIDDLIADFQSLASNPQKRRSEDDDASTNRRRRRSQ